MKYGWKNAWFMAIRKDSSMCRKHMARWLEMRPIKCFVQTMKLTLELHEKDILINEHDLCYLLGSSSFVA